MSQSGSVASRKVFQARSSSRSSVKQMTSAPTMGAHVPSVITVFTAGLRSPWTVTKEAIWMTGSILASGKWPCSESG